MYSEFDLEFWETWNYNNLFFTDKVTSMAKIENTTLRTLSFYY